MKKIQKLLVANRSEIAIRVFRTAHELGIRTVAIYSHEDRYALHRFKADEAYQVGKPGEPIRAYLDIDGIIARRPSSTTSTRSIPATASSPRIPSSPGPATRRASSSVGPQVEVLEQLGDKIAARDIAEQAGVPVLGGSDEPITTSAEGRKSWPRSWATRSCSRRPRAAADAACASSTKPRSSPRRSNRHSANRWPRSAAPTCSSKSSSQRARHIEVQLLGDKHGNLVHLYERDCSVQRRHQKVVEIAPAPNLDPRRARRHLRRGARDRPRGAATRTPARSSSWSTPTPDKFYFIEVNPRIQVEHTVTEEVTGVDIVKSQILVAQGEPLADPEIGLAVAGRRHARNGFALQCRVTTEDPENDFMPDYGRIAALPLGRRHGHPARCRHRVFRRRGHAVLRFAAGEGDRLGPPLHRRRAAHGALPAGVPHPRREDEHSVPDQPGHAPQVSWPANARRGSSTKRPSCSSSPSGRTARPSC